MIATVCHGHGACRPEGMNLALDPSRPVLFSLGSINADLQLQVAAPLEGREILPATRFERLPGGKAANVAWLAARLGQPAVLLGRVGRDEFAAQALEPLALGGVDVRAVRRGPGSTGVAIVVVPPGGKKQIVAAGEANQALGDADIDAIERILKDAPAGSVLVADYEVTAQAVSRALAVAHDRGLKVVVDPSFPDRVPPADLALIDVLTPNEEEARTLAGIAGQGLAASLAAARALASRGPRTVAIKLDGGGCLLWHEGCCWRLQAAPVEVVDTTGAGDAFTGAFAIALMRGDDALEAARQAVAASEVAVTAFGAQPSFPDAAALRQRLALEHRCERCDDKTEIKE
jgi:ribokinase